MTAIIDFQRINYGKPLIYGQVKISAFGENPVENAGIPIFWDEALENQIGQNNGGGYTINENGDIIDQKTGLAYQTAYVPGGYSIQLLDKYGIEIFRPFRQIRDPEVASLPVSVFISVDPNEIIQLEKSQFPDLTDNCVVFVNVNLPEDWMPGDPDDFGVEITQASSQQFADNAEIEIVNVNSISPFGTQFSGSVVASDGTQKVLFNRALLPASGIFEDKNSSLKIKKAQDDVWYLSGDLDEAP